MSLLNRIFCVLLIVLATTSHSVAQTSSEQEKRRPRVVRYSNGRDHRRARGPEITKKDLKLLRDRAASLQLDSLEQAHASGTAPSDDEIRKRYIWVARMKSRLKTEYEFTEKQVNALAPLPPYNAKLFSKKTQEAYARRIAKSEERARYRKKQKKEREQAKVAEERRAKLAADRRRAEYLRAYAAAAARARATAADGTSVSFAELDGRAFIMASDGTYLGSIDSNEYQSKSIMNEYGSHGSRYGSTSIFNDYSQYGGSLGRHSPFNSLASDPPRVYRDKEFVGFLTLNKFKSPRVDPYALIGYLKTK